MQSNPTTSHAFDNCFFWIDISERGFIRGAEDKPAFCMDAVTFVCIYNTIFQENENKISSFPT